MFNARGLTDRRFERLSSGMSAMVIALALGVLPYAEIPSIGPISPFGILVVIGIFAGAKLADGRAVRVGLKLKDFQALVTWTVLGGIVISHIVAELAYHPADVLAKPWTLLNIRGGLSSFGGLFGAALVFNWYGRKHKIDLWRSADCIAYGLPLGFFFGRMGCAVVHDHPGIMSASFLAVDFPATARMAAGPRLDLGLIEMLLLPILILLMWWLDKRVTRPGALIALLAMAYAPLRFPLDFLRASEAEGGDVRYFGLTPGHYAAIGLFIFGVYLYRRSRRAAVG